MTRTIGHPSWCAEGYRCTAALPLGEHRSEPVTLARAGYRVAVVVSLVQRAGRSHPTAEVRLSLRLTSTTSAGQARELRALLRRLATLTREEPTR